MINKDLKESRGEVHAYESKAGDKPTRLLRFLTIGRERERERSQSSVASVSRRPRVHGGERESESSPTERYRGRRGGKKENGRGWQALSSGLERERERRGAQGAKVERKEGEHRKLEPLTSTSFNSIYPPIDHSPSAKKALSSTLLLKTHASFTSQEIWRVRGLHPFIRRLRSCKSAYCIPSRQGRSGRRRVWKSEGSLYL